MVVMAIAMMIVIVTIMIVMIIMVAAFHRMPVGRMVIVIVPHCCIRYQTISLDYLKRCCVQRASPGRGTMRPGGEPAADLADAARAPPGLYAAAWAWLWKVSSSIRIASTVKTSGI